MHNVSYIPISTKLKDLLNAPDDKAAIKILCRQLLKTLNITTTPVALKPICKNLNLKVTTNDIIKSEDSFLKITLTGFEIEISRQKNWRRNRFTIAHELTHLIIFNALGTSITSYEKAEHDQIEKLCDIGAAELLINESELDKYLRTYGLNTDGIKNLYDKFMVSHDALFYKLSDFLNANIIVWKSYSRNALEKKEMRVFRHFPTYKFADKKTWLPNGCTGKHISPNVFETNLSYPSCENTFKIIMKDRSTECSCISFLFPHSRNANVNLPIFENISIADESIYDDCVIMLVFRDKMTYEKVKLNYILNEK